MSQVSTLEEGIDLEALAKKHELTGGMIMNIVRYCSLMSVNRGEYTIRLSDAERGIQKELLKEGRIM
jgi:ATP-dependent 26S proteasome regulatory subunit